MKKYVVGILSLLVCVSCNKIAKQGIKVAEKEVVEETMKKTISKSLQERLEATVGTKAAAKLVNVLEDKPDLLSLLEKNGDIFYTWVYLNKQLPKSSLNYDFVKLFLYSEKYSKLGRFGGNKIENFVYKEGKDGEVFIMSKSGLNLGKISIFYDPPRVSLYEVNEGKVIRNMFANIHPFPNVQYDLGGVTYKTDSWGRVISSEFTIDKNYMSKPNLYNAKDITAIGKLKGGMVGDDGGHLLAQQFGGSSTVLNVVPMKASVNRTGEYKRLEKLWNKAADEGKVVKTKVNLKYGNTNTERPDWIEVKYEINGETFTKLIANL